MPRTAKLYLPLDVDFFEGHRVEQAGEKATYLYLAMCCKAKVTRTDGVLTDRQVASLLVPGSPARLKRLTDVGMISRTDDDRWLIVGFLERNMSAAQIEQARERDRNRKGFRPDSTRNDAGTPSDSPRTLREVEEKEKGSRSSRIPHQAGAA